MEQNIVEIPKGEDEASDLHNFTEAIPPNPELVSEEIHDIISHAPHWIIRRGVSLVGVLFLCLILLSWNIRYRDVVKASLKIVRQNSGIWYGELTAKESDLQRIAVGQIVVFPVEGFAEDYFRGKITSQSSIKKDNILSVQITVPEVSNADYHNFVASKNKMSIEVIVQDTRLLAKMFRGVSLHVKK